MSTFATIGIVAGAFVALGGIATAIYKLCVWVKSLNDLVQHELRPNSGSSIKDAQKHQLEKLDAVLEQMDEDRRDTREWQDGVMLTLGSHEARIDNLEKKK